jgi:hypothetical protein
MAYTLEQVAILQAAIATGSKKVVYGDKEVEYRDLDDMLKTLALMQEELGLVQRQKDTRRFGAFSKGLE